MNIQHIKKAILTLAAVLAFCGISQAQTALTMTTLASSVNGPALYAGTSPTIDNCMTLASVTGISAPTLPGTPVSVFYVGREAFGVLTVNTTSKITCGLRGYLGTQASPHPNGDMVLVAPVYNTANGGNPMPNGFFNQDPPLGGACTAANTPATPWVNVLTGAQWLCSSLTGTWVPGFQNPWAIDSSAQTASVVSGAGANLPTGPLFVVSGSAAIVNWTQPVGCNATAVGGCSFTVISAAGSTWTWTAAGNIMTAGTGTAGHTFTFTWSSSLSKWVPSSLT
jgi:hypothetical protein